MAKITIDTGTLTAYNGRNSFGVLSNVSLLVDYLESQGHTINIVRNYASKNGYVDSDIFVPADGRSMSAIGIMPKLISAMSAFNKSKRSIFTDDPVAYNWLYYISIGTHRNEYDSIIAQSMPTCDIIIPTTFNIDLSNISDRMLQTLLSFKSVTFMPTYDIYTKRFMKKKKVKAKLSQMVCGAMRKVEPEKIEKVIRNKTDSLDFLWYNRKEGTVEQEVIFEAVANSKFAFAHACPTHPASIGFSRNIIIEALAHDTVLIFEKEIEARHYGLPWYKDDISYNYDDMLKHQKSILRKLKKDLKTTKFTNKQLSAEVKKLRVD